MADDVTTVQWQPKGAAIPEGAVDHGLGPAHHGEYSRLVELNRVSTMLEDRDEPSLVYLVREHPGADVRLIVVEQGRSTSWPVSAERLLRLAADATNYLLTGKR